MCCVYAWFIEYVHKKVAEVAKKEMSEYNLQLGRDILCVKCLENKASNKEVLILPPCNVSTNTFVHNVIEEVQDFFFDGGFSVSVVESKVINASNIYEREKRETIDMSSLINWIQENHSNSKELWIFGLSQSAVTALQVAIRRQEVSHFICVSLPTNDLKFAFHCPSRGLFLQSSKDEIISIKETKPMIKKIQKQQPEKIYFTEIPHGNHFFINSSQFLLNEIKAYMDKVSKGEQKSL